MPSPFYPPRIPNPGGLRAGCYLVCYTPDAPDPRVIHYDGTLRVQRVDADGADDAEEGDHVLTSGDLYAHFDDHPVATQPEGEVEVKEIPIPIFPRDEYRYYLCVKSIPCWSITKAGFSMVFESHSYDSEAGMWYPEGQFIAKMRWALPPPGYPAGALHATGDVYQRRGVHNGTLAMTWISEFFRRAELKIHHTTAGNPPGGQDARAEWEKQFAKFNWLLEAEVVTNRKSQPPDGTWTTAQLQDAMKGIRKKQDPDTVWRYDLLCVPILIGSDRGVTLYESEDRLCGHVRELATVAALYKFPTRDDKASALHDYGAAAGKTLQSQEVLYLRTSMHEIGHAMGLNHNTAEKGCMMTTDALAHEAVQTPRNRFPNNARPKFSSGDIQRLRHWPDVLVRPGTSADANVLPAVTVQNFPDNGQDEGIPAKRELAQDVCLFATPLNGSAQVDGAEVPLGAPVRVAFQLLCVGPKAQVPAEPSLKSGALTVWATAPDRTVRSVSPMANEADAGALVQLVQPPTQQTPPNDRVASAVTLLRADDGPLFPVPGEYTIHLEVSWWNSETERECFVTDETKVMITPPDTDDPVASAEHVEAARLILDTPEVQEVLVRHTDIFPAANAALDKALACDILEPHFAYLQFRVKADPIAANKGALAPAFQILLDARKPIFTAPEKEKALKLLLENAQAEKTEPWYPKAKALLEG